MKQLGKVLLGCGLDTGRGTLVHQTEMRTLLHDEVLGDGKMAFSRWNLPRRYMFSFN